MMPAVPSRKSARSKSARRPIKAKVAAGGRSRRSSRRSSSGWSGPSSIDKQLVAYAWLQAIGTNLAAIGQSKSLSNRRSVREEGDRLVIVGNTLQAISNAAQADLILQQGQSESDQLNSIGSLLQALGETLQVFTDLTDPD
ncbi:DUF6944 family repetitive protein [Paenibacillus senegalimassiliensis]|uniref:DUF6944 family repetitive protein n=1 Tax=Paenibacillus senegalimassiliensis TaxID=1737426 RepID=UPI00073F0FF9|nr:hypothetical protein [Paenibacillus senegalimassiliensis]